MARSPNCAKNIIAVLTLLGALVTLSSQVLEGTRHYFFLSDRRIVTVELINEQKAILNYINLGDTYEILEAPGLLILDSGENPHHGHTMEVEDAKDPNQRFKVSELIPPHRYVGYNILGNYRFQWPPQKVFFKVGARILELEALSEEDFELMAAKVAELDLTLENGKQMVLLAGFHQGHGVPYAVGTKEVAAIEDHFPDLDLLSPVVLSDPKPLLPSAFADLPDPVVVQLSVEVSQSGGLFNMQVVKGINPQLDARAKATVQNSWSFLPAISKGKIAAAELILNVVFRRN